MTRTVVGWRLGGEAALQSRLYPLLGVLLTCCAASGCHAAPRRSAHVPRIAVNQAGLESRLAMMGWAHSRAPIASTAPRREPPSSASSPATEGGSEPSADAGLSNVDVR